MLEGSCHCGTVVWKYAAIPDRATACNCTICRRYAALWAYGYEGEETSVTGRTRSYQRQDGGDIMFHACAICHCITHFAGTDTDANGRRRIAVNLRMVAPEMIADIPMRLFDGFGAFEERPSDGRCVRDMWV